MEKMIKSSILGFCLILFSITPAQAVPVTIEISGTLTSIGEHDLLDAIQVNDTFTGSYTYDTSIPDSDPRENVGSYSFETNFRLLIGGYEFKTVNDQNLKAWQKGYQLTIANDYSGSEARYDWYYVRSNRVEPVSGIDAIYMMWELYDYDHDAIGSDELISAAPVLADWDHNLLSIFSDASGSFRLYGNVTQVNVIPEPAMFGLLASGGLALRRRATKGSCR